MMYHELGKNTLAHVSLELNTHENFQIFTDTLEIILTNSFPPQDNKIVWFYILQASHFQSISVLYFFCKYIPVKDMMLNQPFSHVFCILLGDLPYIWDPAMCSNPVPVVN